jgi:serine phosphatase RsbU (regulator of sigma subunit)/Flp pilus assembly protein TadD
MADSLNFLKGKAESLWTIGITYYRKNNELSSEYIHNALKISEEIHYTKGIIRAVGSIGALYSFKGDDAKAIEFTQKAVKLAEEANDNYETAKYLRNLGQFHASVGNYQDALDCLNRALTYSSKMNDKPLMAAIYHNIGGIGLNQGNYALALEYFYNAFKIFEELNDKQGIFVGIYASGQIFLSQSNYPKALEYLQKALKLAEELDDKIRIAGALRVLGDIYSRMNDPQALEYFQRAIKVGEEITQFPAPPSPLIGMGKFYIRNNQYEKAKVCLDDALEIARKQQLKNMESIILKNLGTIYLRKNNFAEALTYTSLSLKMANELNMLETQKDNNQQLAEIYFATNNYRKAYESFKLYKELNDSIYKGDNIKKIVELEYTYKFEKEKQAIELEQQKKDAIMAAQKRHQTIILFSFIGAFILMTLLAFYIYRSYKVKKRSNITLTQQKFEIEAKNEDLVHLNEEITAQREEITSQRDEIETQRDMVVIQKDRIQAQNKLITDSINYAKYIQQALLPSSEYSEANLGDHFILFKPKDIVSGDFYWSTRVNEFLIVTVADCTGHGIPGAFMSMLGISFLNEIVGKKGVIKASDILDQLRNSVIDALKQKWQMGEQKDGMDLALVVINTKTGQLQYAGAHNPLYIVSAGKDLIQLKPDNQTVAINNKMRPFTNQEVQLNKGDSIYLTSDGYHDQFGGQGNGKFKRTQLKELLVKIADKPMADQSNILESTFENWKGNHEQIDDVTILGMKFLA